MYPGIQVSKVAVVLCVRVAGRILFSRKFLSILRQQEYQRIHKVGCVSNSSAVGPSGPAAELELVRSSYIIIVSGMGDDVPILGAVVTLYGAMGNCCF